MRDYGKALEGLEIETFYDSNGLSQRCKTFLYEYLARKIKQEVDDCDSLDTSYYYEQTANVSKVLDIYWPNIDKDEPAAMFIYPDLAARDKGRSGRRGVRIGRALRRMFPQLLDFEIDSLVDTVKSNLMPREYTVHTGFNAKDFAKAYSHTQVAPENLDTGWHKKHSVNSCMRYKFDHMPNHPAEAYASGDFEVIWLEDSDGRIGGRVVVAKSKAGVEIKPKAGPIYAVSEMAYKKLREFISFAEIELGDNQSWVGCQLKAIPYEDGYIAPYLDYEPRVLQEKYAGGSSVTKLEISRDGDIDASQYNGLLMTGGCHCCLECGDSVDENYVYTRDGDSYCENCYHSLFFCCEYCEEDMPRNEEREVNTVNRWGNNQQSWCEHCATHHAVETESGESWDEDHVYTTGDGIVISQDEYDNDYFMCDLVEEIYHNDQSNDLSCGGRASAYGISWYNMNDFTTKYIYDATNEHWVLEPREQETKESA